MNEIISYITNNPVSFIIECVIIIAFIGYCSYFFRKRVGSLPIIIAGIVLFVVSIFAGILEFKVLNVFSLFSCVAIMFMSTRTFLEQSQGKKAKVEVKKELNEEEKEDMVSVLSDTCEFFAKRKIGALIAIEQEDPLNSYVNKSIKIEGEITRELLKTIFFPNTALHDGSVIIQGNKVACAAAYFPLSDKRDIPSHLGTRHRAAIGITEDTDCLVIVISEETGKISVCVSGTITENVSKETLCEMLRNLK